MVATSIAGELSLCIVSLLILNSFITTVVVTVIKVVVQRLRVLSLYI